MATTGLKRDLTSVAGTTGRAAAPPLPKRARSSDCGASHQATMSVDARDFECSICLSLLVDPVVALCGHDFCKSCLDQWTETNSCSSRGVSCPVCRQDVMAPGVTTIGVCVRLQKLIEQLCPQQVEERRREIEEHAAEKARIKQRQNQEQIALVHSIMRARFGRVALTLQQNPEQQLQADNNRLETPHSPSSVVVPTPSDHHSNAAPVPSQPHMPGGTWACARGPQAPQIDPSSSTPTWHCPAQDADIRQATLQFLLQLFSRRNPEMTVSFHRRLPTLLFKLEDVLYRTARSREEYADQAMLESRVQLVARQLTERHASGTSAASQTEVPQSQSMPPIVAIGVPVSTLLDGAHAVDQRS